MWHTVTPSNIRFSFACLRYVYTMCGALYAENILFCQLVFFLMIYSCLEYQEINRVRTHWSVCKVCKLLNIIYILNLLLWKSNFPSDEFDLLYSGEGVWINKCTFSVPCWSSLQYFLSDLYQVAGFPALTLLTQLGLVKCFYLSTLSNTGPICNAAKKVAALLNKL